MSCKRVSRKMTVVGDGSKLHKKIGDEQNKSSENMLFTCDVKTLQTDYTQEFISVKEENVSDEEKFKIGNSVHNNVINPQPKVMRKMSSKETKKEKNCTEISNTCSVCNKNFMNLKKLKRHLKSHEDKLLGDKLNKYFCAMCEKGFRWKSDLPRHYSVHTKSKTFAPPKGTIFTCDFCGKMCTSKKNLISHIIYHNEKCTCHLCGKRFTDGGFRYHLKHVHGGVKNYHCDICDRKFVSKGNLLDHMRIHTGEKPFMCPTCGKLFRNDNALYLHKRSHTDIFPLSCGVCGKGFRRNKELNYHLMTHSGVKPCPCDVCGKTFRKLSEVRSHRVMHFDDRPFVCPVCHKSFKLQKHLKQHNKTHKVKKEHNF